MINILSKSKEIESEFSEEFLLRITLIFIQAQSEFLCQLYLQYLKEIIKEVKKK